MSEQDVSAQLFLVVETGDSARDRLSAALAAGQIASVLIVPPSGRDLALAEVQPLIAAAQAHGAAALLPDAELARLAKADGVHLRHSDDIAVDFRDARAKVGAGSIIGGHAGNSRHDAMMLGELGADYVAFGLPRDVDSEDAARNQRFELVQWWVEIFEVPCVAFDVEDRQDIIDLAEAGADFIGITLPAGISPADAAERVRLVADALSAAEVG